MQSKKYIHKKYLPKTRKLKKNIKKKTMNDSCKVLSNTFSRFEDEYEKSEIFIKKGMHTKSEVEKKLINMIEVGSRDPLRPQDDFYGLVNNIWIRDAKLTKDQQYIIQLDDFRLVQYKVYNELVEIIAEYIKNNKNNLSRQLNNFYTAVNKSLTETKFNHYCKKYIEQLDEMRKDKKNLWKLVAMLNKNEFMRIGSPIVCTINSDEKKSNIFSPHVNIVTLSLSDPQVYINDGKDLEYKNKIKTRYFKYIQQLSNIELNDKTIDNKIWSQKFVVSCSYAYCVYISDFRI